MVCVDRVGVFTAMICIDRVVCFVHVLTVGALCALICGDR